MNTGHRFHASGWTSKCLLIESQARTLWRGCISRLKYQHEIGGTEEILVGIEFFLAIHALYYLLSSLHVPQFSRKSFDKGLTNFFILILSLYHPLSLTPH